MVLRTIGRQLQRVGARGLEDRNRDRLLVVEEAAHAVGLGAELHARDVAEAHHLSVVTGLDDDVAELLLVAEPAGGVQRDLKFGLFEGGAPSWPAATCTFCSRIAVDHVAGRQIAHGEFLRVEPDAHRVVAAAEDLHVAHAREAAPARP